MKRLCVFGIFLICVLLCILSCGGNDTGSKTLKFSLILGDQSDWYSGAKRFSELIEERTSGRYRVKIYPHAQLAGHVQRTELEMVQTGVIDISLESTILLSLIEPRMSIPTLPWLFESYDVAQRVLDSPVGDELLGLLPAKGIIGLAYGVNGFRQLTNSRNPVFSPDDISAMKIRVPAIKMYIELFKGLDADPSSMNFGELFTALAQKTMDGQENPLSVIHSARLYEVQKYVTMWNYSYDPLVLCINKKLWDSFSVEDQHIFDTCAHDAMDYERSIVADGEQALMDSLRMKGMQITILDDESLQEFKSRSEYIYESISVEIGSDLVNRFRETSAKEGIE